MVSGAGQQREAYQLAVDARDPRFDGVFFVGITTTHAASSRALTVEVDGST